METFASIDIGTHTARLLVAQDMGLPGLFRPLVRKRAYIRLGDGFLGKKNISPSALDRTLKIIKDFSICVKTYGVYPEAVRAVATGVVREAANSEEFVHYIYEHTGIHVRPITGDEEARLTGKGVFHALGIRAETSTIFDLGGGSTEFLTCIDGATTVRSIPLGALILTDMHLHSDPPEEKQILRLIRHVDMNMKEANLPVSENPYLMVGTGGTVVALAAILHGISLDEITQKKINGLVLRREKLKAFFDEIKSLGLKERMRYSGLDRGRADVILAGCLIAIRILYFFKSVEMTVSLSDLLEGVLIDCFNPNVA